MHLSEIEAYIRDSAMKHGLVVHKTLCVDGVLRVYTRPVSPSETEGRQEAVIWSSGADAFFLDLDGRYSFGEYEYEKSAQPSAVRLLLRLAAAYFAGNGKRVQKRTILGRDSEYLEVALDGELFAFSLMPGAQPEGGSRADRL